jgi:hypothetical protein
MLRKTLVALSAVAVLAAASIAPTTASAGGGGKFFKHGKFFHSHVGWGVYPAYGFGGFGPYCYWEKKFTPFGWKVVKVCSYY